MSERKPGEWMPDDVAVAPWGQAVRVIGRSLGRSYLLAVETPGGWVKIARDFELKEVEKDE